MMMALVLFTRGRIIRAVETAEVRFPYKMIEFMKRIGHGVLSIANGDEAWILPAVKLHMIEAGVVGIENQRQAIRTADGARDAGKYFE